MPSNGKRTPLIYYNDGIKYFEEDDFKNAIKSFNKAFESVHQTKQKDIGFDLAEAYNMRGRSYFEDSDEENSFSNFNKAIDDFSEAIQINQNRYKYYYNRALARNEALYFIDDEKIEKEYIKKQIEDMEMAISIALSNEKGVNKEDLCELHTILADYNLLEENFDKAKITYEKALELNPDDTETLTKLSIVKNKIILLTNSDNIEANFNIARSYSELEQYEDAVKYLTTVIEHDDQNKDAYFERGCAYSNLDDDENALADLDKVLEFDEKNTDAYFERGCVYSKLDDDENALADFDKVLEFDPDSSRAYYQKADIYSLQGNSFIEGENYEEAEKAFSKSSECFKKTLELCQKKPEMSEIDKGLIFNSHDKLQNDYFLLGYIDAGFYHLSECALQQPKLASDVLWKIDNNPTLKDYKEKLLYKGITSENYSESQKNDEISMDRVSKNKTNFDFENAKYKVDKTGKTYSREAFNKLDNSLKNTLLYHLADDDDIIYNTSTLKDKLDARYAKSRENNTNLKFTIKDNLGNIIFITNNIYEIKSKLNLSEIDLQQRLEKPKTHKKSDPDKQDSSFGGSLTPTKC